MMSPWPDVHVYTHRRDR